MDKEIHHREQKQKMEWKVRQLMNTGIKKLGNEATGKKLDWWKSRGRRWAILLYLVKVGVFSKFKLKTFKKNHSLHESNLIPKSTSAFSSRFAQNAAATCNSLPDYENAFLRLLGRSSTWSWEKELFLAALRTLHSPLVSYVVAGTFDFWIPQSFHVGPCPQKVSGAKKATMNDIELSVKVILLAVCRRSRWECWNLWLVQLSQLLLGFFV